jgi:hypothetical protein
MIKKGKKSGEHLRISRLRWVIGAPYFVQGTSTLTEIPILYFIKYTLQMGDAGGQLFDALRQSGAEVARMSAQPGWEYAEGFRQHSHVGFSARDRDILSEVLGDSVAPRTVTDET